MVRVMDTAGRKIAPRSTGLSFGGSGAYNPFSGSFPVQRPRATSRETVGGGGVGGYFSRVLSGFNPFDIAPSQPFGAAGSGVGAGSGAGATVGGVATNGATTAPDGQGGFLGNLLNILGAMGSTGDGPVEVVPVAYSPGSSRGGATPTMIIAGGAALIGLLVFLKK